MEQLSDPKQKEITRYQIRKRVEQLLKIEDLAAVYFTDFILQ
jgi:flagellar basal body-associated protein FliL